MISYGTVWIKSLTNKWHILQSDWSVRPITRTAFQCKNVLRYFGKVQLKPNICILRFDWLIALYIFFLLVLNASLLIVKKVVSGKNSAMSKNHCERTSCGRVRSYAPHLWFVHLPNLHVSLHLPPLQRPGMCAVKFFQRLRFGDSSRQFHRKA